jgi:hypothetical protein
MRFLIPLILTLLLSCWGRAGELEFAKVVKASVIFRTQEDREGRYPHILKVFLRLDNLHDADVSWVSNKVRDIDAELFDGTGNPAKTGPTAGSVPSNRTSYLLPHGSRLDWLVSHGGVSMAGETKDHYALIVGGRGWLIPIKEANTYTLKIRLHGLPFQRNATSASKGSPEKLLDLPPVKIQIEPG